MGKRELVIIVALLLVGGAVYRLTAPPPAEGQDEGFSIGRLVDEIRTEIAEDSTWVTLTHTGTIELGSVKRVRIGGFSGEISVTGEDRADIAYQVEVDSSGPDEDAARSYAKRTVLVEDVLGDTLSLRMQYPPEATQRTALVLQVPSHLGVALEQANSRSFIIKDLAALHLSGVLGEVTAESIGAVTGDHRNGRLTITGAGDVTLSLLNSRATFNQIQSELALHARGGEVTISDSEADVVVQQTNAEVMIENHEGTIRAFGSGGELGIIAPRAYVDVDVRSTDVEVIVAHPVPMTIFTTSEPLRLVLDGDPSFVLDAMLFGGGDIEVTDLDLELEGDSEREWVRHAFGDASGPRVSLRNRGDDIVIRKRK